jgi:hypothetical protein
MTPETQQRIAWLAQEWKCSFEVAQMLLNAQERILQIEDAMKAMQEYHKKFELRRFMEGGQ